MESVRPVVIAHTVRVDFRSRINQRFYSISIALPLVAPVKDRDCGVLYVLDGDWYFASAVEAVRAHAPWAAVVGVGYPDADDYVADVLKRHHPLPAWAKDEPAFKVAVGFERMYDLSLPASDEILARDLVPDGWVKASDVGGLEAFLEVLEREIKPRVGAMAPINSANQAIFGHSLGGLAVLHALFVAPSRFRTFIAASPSIWWSDRAVLRGEKRFAEAVRGGTANPRVLITTGSEEQTVNPKVASKLAMEFAGYAERVRKHRMVENAKELADRLRALRASDDVEIGECAVFANQDHDISPWPALGRAISFAFPI